MQENRVSMRATASTAKRDVSRIAIEIAAVVTRNPGHGRFFFVAERKQRISLFILNAMQIANVRSVVRTLGYKNRSTGWMRIIITCIEIISYRY